MREGGGPVAAEWLPGKAFREAPMGLTPEAAIPDDATNVAPLHPRKASDNSRGDDRDRPESRYNTDRNSDGGTEGLNAVFEVREIGGPEGRALSTAQAVRAALEWATRHGDGCEQEAA
jgi:hypothetical protein